MKNMLRLSVVGCLLSVTLGALPSPTLPVAGCRLPVAGAAMAGEAELPRIPTVQPAGPERARAKAAPLTKEQKIAALEKEIAMGKRVIQDDEKALAGKADPGREQHLVGTRLLVVEKERRLAWLKGEITREKCEAEIKAADKTLAEPDQGEKHKLAQARRDNAAAWLAAISKFEAEERGEKPGEF